MSHTCNFPCMFMDAAARNRVTRGSSNVYLTKHNFAGPHLLKTIRSKDLPMSCTHKDPTSFRTMVETEDDLMRSPESSQDEQDLAKSDGKPHLSTSPPSPKRKWESARHTRVSKRQKLQDDAGLAPLPARPQSHTPASQNTEMTDMLFSQSSQTKRGKYTTREKAQARIGRPAPKRLEDNGTRLDFTDMEERETTPPKKTRAFGADDMLGQQTEDLSANVNTLVSLPAEEEIVSSASTSATKVHIFEGTPEPDGHGTRSKLLSSPPTSPEVLDINDLPEEVPQQESESHTVTCPVCHQAVDCTSFPVTEKAPRLLPLKRQQEFCRHHRSHEAESVRKDRNYPVIDWQVLSLVRIPRQMPHLRQVLRRKAKCYYLDQLEANVAETKGNRKAIRNYLTEGVLDVAKAGYYGPKGTGLMMESVTSQLSKDLINIMSDKLVRSVGMGGYVTAVLVPELTLRLVMDDMNIKDETVARIMLNESTEIGLLLNPDDDHVEQLDHE